MPRLYLKEVEPFIGTSGKYKVVKRGDANGTQTDVGDQTHCSHHKTKRNTSLIATDALLLCLEFLQVLAVLQTMSLKWIWPKTWLRTTNFIFFFTADVWEYIKVDCGAFIGVRNYDSPSINVSTRFYYILLGWAVAVLLMGIILGTIKIVVQRKKPAYLLMYNAKLLRAVVIIFQIFALPFGVTAFKVFQCTRSGLMSVDNTVECWSGLHWAYVVPVLVAVVGLFVVFPAWMFWRIYHESLASADLHHEDFLKLKEVEYMSGLDVVWAVKSLYLFSSFNLRAIYYRPVAHMVKLLLLVIYAASFQNISGQAMGFAVVLLLVAVGMMVLRPFRLMLFNVVTSLGYFCLTGDAVFGAVITQFRLAEIESAWLVEPYSLYVLVALNGVVLLTTIATFLIYLLAYHLCCRGRCALQSLWPVMTSYECDVEGVETHKYLAAVLRGRALIEKCRRLPPIFVPVHEMANQICILNAYMRESEFMHDGLHPTLWAVLDEMIDMHQRLEPKSLFGDMVHAPIRKNAAHFMTLMPMFAQRLAQRDYDFIFLSPLKKRLLMKMYIIAMFWEGSHKRKTHQMLTQEVLSKIWEESPEIIMVTDEREYHEELYPRPAAGPDTEALYSTGTLDLGHGLYDLEMDEEEERLSSFLKRAPLQLVLLDEESIEAEKERADVTGTDNHSFVPDDGQQRKPEGHADNQTTAHGSDHSETRLDAAVDFHARQSQDKEEIRTLELDGYEAGESSIDGGVDEVPDEKRRGRSDTEASVISVHSQSSSSSTGQRTPAASGTSNALSAKRRSSGKSASPSAKFGSVAARPSRKAKSPQKATGKKTGHKK